MFSFHKPKIYRSHLGCCICKAKSSSSRFTDSKKYENEFEHCFRIQEKRSGEICNACVLLVKRWKKLSPESRLTKHWHHVVDARAGPGTKLTGNRRLTMGSSSGQARTGAQHESGSAAAKARKSDVLPLSLSSQVNNQTTGAGGAAATSSAASQKSTRISNKARAIDTNVSHFTFGEPHHYRRNYMLSEQQAAGCANAHSSSYSSQSSVGLGSSGLIKPQSALNSSAFESVIKRFRQRQQQQQLDAKRRELNRQQRQQRSAGSAPAAATHANNANSTDYQQQEPSTSTATSGGARTGRPIVDNNEKLISMTPPAEATVKRSKRSSSTAINHNNGSSGPARHRPTQAPLSSSPSAVSAGLSGDLLKICSLLDTSIWRKEKICCGYIFRGRHNEVAIFPKLLKPCRCRADKSASSRSSPLALTSPQKQPGEPILANEHQLLKARQALEDSPPPRATKSGSISSCDSNTSGTGSMEQPLDEIQSIKRAISVTSGQLDTADSGPTDKTTQLAADKRPTSAPARRGRRQRRLQQRQHLTNDNDTSSSSSSSSRLMMLATDEDEEDDHDHDHDDQDMEEDDVGVGGLILDEEDACESSNDASSSSIESLAEKATEQVATS